MEANIICTFCILKSDNHRCTLKLNWYIMFVTRCEAAHINILAFKHIWLFIYEHTVRHTILYFCKIDHHNLYEETCYKCCPNKKEI